jgi:hypothetical protein
MPKPKKKSTFVPCTPGGSVVMHLESSTREIAIKRLLKDASHMPYGTWENFEKRGYTILELKSDG